MNPEARVSEFITQSREWDVNKLSQFLPPTIVADIANILIPTYPTQDLLRWMEFPIHKVPLKALYLEECRKESMVYTDAPPLIWKLRVAPQVRAWLWKAHVDGVAMNESLHRRSLITSPTCTRCTSEIESIEHILFDYSWVKNVWDEFCIRSGLEAMPRTIGEWWTCINSDQVGRGDLWLVWKARCKYVFTGETQTATSIVNTAISRIVELWQVEDLPKVGSDNTTRMTALGISMQNISNSVGEEVWVRWEAPAHDRIKINFDGSLDTDKAGYGFTIRDAKGRLLLEGGGAMRTKSINVVERHGLWAALKYLNLVMHNGPIEVEGDSLVIIN